MAQATKAQGPLVFLRIYLFIHLFLNYPKAFGGP